MSDCQRFRVRGRVQGVGFRAHTRSIALTYQLSGWAHNCSDGSVDILLCGPAEKVLAAKSGIVAGPRHARVDQVEVLEAPAVSALDGFSIR